MPRTIEIVNFSGNQSFLQDTRNKLHGMGLKKRKQNLALQLHVHVTIQMKLLCVFF